MRKKLFALACILACTLLHFAPSQACTSFLVGKAASADGSAFITYNADDYGMFGTLRFFPAATHPKGAMRRIIDLGPEGGDKGGHIVVAGTPEEVAACPASHTGRFLKPLL